MNIPRTLCTLHVLIFIILIWGPQHFEAKQNTQKTAVDEVTDIKDFKKILRTKNNVLVCYVSSLKQASQIIKIFREAAETIKGQGTMLLVDCSSSESKKMCKKLKVNPEPFMLKHYKDGEFHKDYDRLETVQSMVNFMRDPSGDIPWEEDSSATDVVHIADAVSLLKFLRKESRPVMVMFYAPWCGFCKQLKPEYALAASALKGHSLLAAIDVNRPENSVLRQQYNITGFPTMLYFQNGVRKLSYEGENNQNGLVGFMKNPRPAEKPKEVDWESIKSDVVHLNSDNFDSTLKGESSVLVMFYAPWCGHCKKMKPEYEIAAEILKAEKVPGILAAVDATKEPSLASRFGIRGYPSVKYFRSGGEFAFDVSVREATKITDFMRDPREPPPPPPPEKPWSDEPSEVAHLDEETFKPFLRKKRHALVMFYAPWCGHCKKAKPEFSAAADKFAEDPKVEFAAVDCTLSSSVCGAMEVKGYPTFKYFHYYTKESKSYNGGRLEADFISFMRDPLNPLAGAMPAVETTDKEPWGQFEGAEHLVHLTDSTFDTALSAGEPMLVVFYAPWCGHCKKMKPAYSLAARQLKQDKVPGVLATVDSTVCPQLTQRYSIPGYPTIKFFNKGRLVSEYDKNRSLDEFTAFMKSAPAPRDEL